MSLNFMMLMTGPKISSCAIFMSSLHVGEDGGLDEIAAVADAFAAAQQLRAFALACVDVAHDLVELFLDRPADPAR